jgi:hypothetical protein
VENTYPVFWLSGVLRIRVGFDGGAADDGAELRSIVTLSFGMASSAQICAFSLSTAMPWCFSVCSLCGLFTPSVITSGLLRSSLPVLQNSVQSFGTVPSLYAAFILTDVQVPNMALGELITTGRVCGNAYIWPRLFSRSQHFSMKGLCFIAKCCDLVTLIRASTG